jgi:hypothetical protein
MYDFKRFSLLATVIYHQELCLAANAKSVNSELTETVTIQARDGKEGE